MTNAYSAMPNFVAIVQKDLLRVEHARDIIERAGGAAFVLDQLSSGRKMVLLAQELRVSIAQINAYLRAACDPADVEAAMASQIRSRVELLDEDADNIEDLKKRFDAKKELLFWQADKETEKYKGKQADVPRGGVTINIDWSQFSGVQPGVVVDANV